MRSGTFGIHMKRYCRDHENALRARSPGPALLDRHLEKLRWLQHERLVHLIVTVMVVICELFAVGLVLLHPELGVVPAVIMLGLAVLLAFYFSHYFFLENTVQRWYLIADELREAAERRTKDEADAAPEQEVTDGTD